ncbi:isochorismatase family protein [Heyndrickxia acidicola]|uniref:Isochorismatase family protein n=1 Tax=Heyndrickxia acidicola TaxID=209389 RepID=A0ABU6MMA6_9BACI|nr:isochorismatase family protein [Heyndrickxia acidicola]MED1205537.1 isochorismatase family protein [Heyndrickxia acidicola]
MEAVLLIDITEDFIEEKEKLNRIRQIVNDFKNSSKPIIFLSHIKPAPSSFSRCSSLLNEADYVLNQKTPSCYFNADLSALLETLNVNHLYLIGNNKNSCCRYIASSAKDKGYNITYCESGFSQLEDYDTYEMKGLDFLDFSEQEDIG